MSKTILVVDDELDILKVITFRIEKAGYKVLQAVTGQQALDLIKENRPDLIILDLVLPVIDGYEVCKRIKNNDEYKQIPIIILTASCTSDFDKKLKDTKADGCLIKPFDIEELLAKVKNLLFRKGR